MRFSFLLCLVSLLLSLQAQIVNPKKIRFGKFSDQELALETYTPDPEAEAVILFNESIGGMQYDMSAEGLELVENRHQRIKILKSSGVDYATFRFRLSSSNISLAREEVVSIKGVTVNMVDGKPVETKLTKDGIFREEIVDGLDQITITFPQVKAGSIIDLKYVYKSDYLSVIPTWYFQRRIPTDYSYYEAVFPEYFYYSIDMQGFGNGLLIQNDVAETGNGSMIIPGNNDPFKFITRTYRWAAVEVPGLQPEPYAPAVSNYFFRVNFELASVNFPGQLGTNYSQSWDDIVTYYRKFSGNRAYLNPREVVAQKAIEWAGEATTANERLIRIYEGVKRTFSWDNVYTLTPGITPGRLLEVESGNSGDINYLLISALRAAGLEAYPVLVSTADNGYLSLTRPSLLQFNHVIVAAILPEGQSVLLDATRPDVPLPLLARQDLNERGRLIREEDSEWVSLVAPASDKTALQVKLSLSEDGQLTGTAKYKASDYAALKLRRSNNAENIPSYLQKWTGQAFSETVVSGFDNYYEDISIEAALDASEALTKNENLYYFSGILAKYYADNPFTSEERLLPVDWQIPQDHVYVLQLELPENIMIEELPESINFSLPEGKGNYSLRFIELNGNLQIIEKLAIKEPLFYAAEYAALKKFFELVIEQEEAIVVLKEKE